MLFDALNENWVTYLHTLRASRKRARMGAVHDLRTAIRRISAALELIEKAVPDCPEAPRLRRLVRRELKRLRDLRDLQVEGRYVRNQGTPTPAVRALSRKLKRDAGKEKKRARRFLASRVDVQRQSKLLRRINDSLLASERSEATLARVWRRASAEIQSRYRAFAAAADAARARPEDASAMHRARIRLKKLRYAREALAPAFGHPRRLESRFSSLQDILGAVQDATVLLGELEGFASSHRKTRDDPGFARLLRNLERERETAVHQLALKRETAVIRSLRPRPRRNTSRPPS